MMCQFVDDIEQVVELLRGRNDFEIVEERNYISHKKASGYRSYHVVIRYPVQTIHGEKKYSCRNSNQDSCYEFLGDD